MKLLVKLFILSLVFTGLSACTTKREQTFEATIRAYEQVIRWRNIEKVNQFRKKPLVFSNVARERLKNIKVTKYEIVSIENDSQLSKIVNVSIKYYHEQYARERMVSDRQKWHFDEATEHWYISSPIPEF